MRASTRSSTCASVDDGRPDSDCAVVATQAKIAGAAERRLCATVFLCWCAVYRSCKLCVVSFWFHRPLIQSGCGAWQ